MRSYFLLFHSNPYHHAVAAFLPCTVTGVVSLAEPTAAAVYGYAAVQWYSAPTTTQLNFASAQIVTLLQGLATNTSGIFAGTNLTVTPNCACDGNELVTNPSTQAFGYSPIIGSNLPGAACDARLSSTPSVGIDNGSVTPANRGKFCSSPQLVAGGVAGTPGTGSCAVYGVSTGVTTLSATATVDGLIPVGGTVTGSGSKFSTFPLITASSGPATFSATVSVDSIGVTLSGEYGAVPTVVLSGPGATTQATATAQMSLFSSALPTFLGVGCPADIYPVTILNGGFTTAPIVTLTVGAGGIATALTVVAPGVGWTSSPSSFTIGTGTNLNSLSSCTTPPTIDSGDFSLGVTSVTVTSPSSKYTAIPTVAFAGGLEGIAATATATVKLSGVKVEDLGVYTSPPALLVTGTSLTAATATALMGISGITVVDGGSTYTSAPAVTITQGSGAGATAQAVVVGGSVDKIVVTAEGSGFLTIPTVFIAAPASSPSTVGLLCAASGQFIAASGSLPAVGIQTATGPTTATGTPCAPIAINTIAALPCSTPQLATVGVVGIPAVGTCGVVSSFVPAATSTVATTCALIPQAFTTTVTPGAPSPSPKAPAPSPKAPAPSPAAPACSYAGNYRMEAVGRAACGVEFPSYYGGSPANQTLCSTQSIQLRTEKQLPKVDRATFEITAAGEIKTVRRGCAAGEAAWTPEGEKLRLRNGVAPKFTIEASAGDCNLVAIKSNLLGSRAPYVSSPSPSGTQGCKSRQLFMTDKIYDTGRQLFRLRKV